ncbi:hypothetical protein [Ferruginibacter sp. HRS2-29]|uniref:hypothetical protein n=1 Tax=Ferruginibacter sp. HRS2-29 TaxID=2487334 RepID=UPI0020CC412C|nr:hypothetical protein [Ferruginibacter sp. HRS2-29]MCP9752062.1 redox-active disulfide protein 2 [Ferruginibacter sp. HRS2-29]
MAKLNLSEISDQELLRNEKLLKTLIPVFITALVILFVSSIFLGLRKGFSALSVVPVALLPVLIINIKSRQEIRKEIKARNL